MADLSNVLIGDNDVNNPPIKNQDDTTNIDGHKEETTNIDNNPPANEQPANPPANPPANEPISIDGTELTEGMEIETPDGVLIYKNGTLVNDKGEVFKNADEVKDYISQFNSDEGNDNLNLASLQSILGVEITGEDGKAVEFTDDKAGIDSYVNKVFELKQKEAEDVAMNTFFANNPMVKQFHDFITAGGNPAQFAQIPDRSNIQFNPEDGNQHKAIIRVAWNDNNNRGDVEKYIKYLEDSGSLADVAKEELEAIKQRDAEYKKEIEKRAEEVRREEQESLTKYWNTIYSKIDSGMIAGYKIPESIVKEVDGQKIALTRKDFFNYLNRIDPNTRMSQYQMDLNNMSEDDYMNRELLDAYLHFSGGTYQDLIKMAVKDEEVKRLKLTTKQARTPGTIKVNKPQGNKVAHKDIIL